MVEEQWKRVSDIFHDALELPVGDRDRYVFDAAAGDASIESEVRGLIEADNLVPYDYMPALMSQDTSEVEPRHRTPLLPGDVVAGRFHIVKAVGEGGMGHVFEAYDAELAVTVALKVIHPGVASDRHAASRFVQEVRLARRITHPNVCRTFDINREARVDAASGKSSEMVFLTMEFLEGETLATRLKRTGILSPDEALLIASQVAAALTAAHSLDIIHRDIKPSNILLVQGEPRGPMPLRAVITDFGLARLNPVLPGIEVKSSAPSNQFVGTLAYMAPEQMDGSPVSPATDIYAFGLVLFEMITGRRAFPSDSLLNGIWQRISGEPLFETNSAILAHPWKDAIAGCLQRLPSERFQCAEEVMSVLRGSRLKQRTPEIRSVQSALASSLVGRTWIGKIAAALIAVILFVVCLRLYEMRGKPEVAAGSLIYLAPISNRTGDKALDDMTELLRAGISQSTQVNFVSEERVGDIMQQMVKAPGTVIDANTAREIAMRAGAVRVIFGTVSRSEGENRFEVDIQQPDSLPSRYRNRWRKAFHWQTTSVDYASKKIPDELLTQVRAASDWVRQMAGESQHDIARLDIPPEDVTTGDWEALMDFDQAERWLTKGRKDEAITLLREAVRRDPGFARASAELADNLVSMGKLSEGYEAYLQALNNESGERLTRKERDRIKAAFATDTRDYEAAVEAFQDGTAFYENDFYAWAYQAFPLDKLDRPHDALRVLERADRLTPNHGAVGQMAYPYMLLGNYVAAKRTIAMARSEGRLDLALYLDGLEAMCEGDYSRAGESFVRLKQMDHSHLLRLGYLGEIRLLAEEGRYGEAFTSVTNAISSLDGAVGDEEKAKLWLDRSYLEFRLGHERQALEDTGRALDSSSTPDTLLYASTIVGEAIPTLAPPETRQARLMLARMEASLPQKNLGVVFSLAREQVRGELLLAEGDALGALTAFRTAAKLDAPIAPREYLARGLLAVAVQQHDPAQASALRLEALKIYARVATRPATAWIDLWSMPPGFVADRMTAYLNVARKFHHSDSNTASVATSLAALRKSSSVASTPPRAVRMKPRTSHIR
ncbi:tetratricopeptide (TPR) repeat protein [Granulicella aggregans]|uniref:Tetratricopeptide (TPR) repeat protein n=1 Tax=Granulicella aggregans TaxID=474949 RepID=A0A7W8E4B2_9BACT|nr:serine/threonine-protein kinase [Granulicella aggregans]MBB5058863.1 tetratricopeptide (TPR) repeat protein [Granulicella aggregans]